MWQGECDKIFTNFRANSNIVQILLRRITISPVIYQMAFENIKQNLGTISTMKKYSQLI